MKLSRKQLRKLILESVSDDGVTILADDAAESAIEELLKLQAFPHFNLEASQVELKLYKRDGEIVGVYLDLSDNLKKSDDEYSAFIALESIFNPSQPGDNEKKSFFIIKPFLDLDGANKGKTVRRSSGQGLLDLGIGFALN